MRNQGKLRLGYFPLPLAEARRIRACLSYPASPVTAIDPCIGGGAAFLAITGEACARRYGIELDAYRAEQAAAVVDQVIHGDCLEVHCLVESFGLAFLNPPYDWTMGQGRSERTERVFLAHTYRWLKTAGVLVLVVPAAHVRECGEILASQFKAHPNLPLDRPGVRAVSPGRGFGDTADPPGARAVEGQRDCRPARSVRKYREKL